MFLFDCYKEKKMSDKADDSYCQSLKISPECFKTQKMFYKVDNDLPSVTQPFLDRYKTQETFNKAVTICPFVFDSVPGQYKTRRMFDSCFWRTFMLKYCPDKYKGKETCGNAVDDVLVFANGDIFFYDVDCNNITFPNDDVVLSNIDRININLDDDIFDEDDPETIDHVRLMTWRNK